MCCDSSVSVSMSSRNQYPHNEHSGTSYPECLIQSCFGCTISSESGIHVSPVQPAIRLEYPSSNALKSAADPESLDMNMMVPSDMWVCSNFWATMMGPIVLVRKCFSKLAKDLRCLSHRLPKDVLLCIHFSRPLPESEVFPNRAVADVHWGTLVFQHSISRSQSCGHHAGQRAPSQTSTACQDLILTSS